MKTLESFKFKAGVLTIFDDVIEYKSTDGKTKLQMTRKNFDSINVTHYKVLAGQVTQYGFLSGFTGLILILINVFGFSDKMEILNIIGGFFMGFGLFLIFGFIFLDAIMGIKLTSQICLALFGEKGYKVSIQNNSGGDHIEFTVLESEKVDTNTILKYKTT